MALLYTLLPESAAFPDTDMPELEKTNDRYFLHFNTTTQETCYWQLVAPQSLTSPYSAVIHWSTTVTTGTGRFGISFEAITSGTDTINMLTGRSFATETLHTAQTVEGTASNPTISTISSITDDGLATGDLWAIRFRRDVDGDNAAADLSVVAVEIRDSA